ncbi:MAG: TetR/AcrR family transcriptional regulator [Anaerolineae bacterium]
MPYPSKVNYEDIVNQAWDLVESEGFEQLSLAHLAESLGVRASSLYRYVKNKAELVQAVNEQTHHKLFTALNAVPVHDDALTHIMGIAQAYRAFAHAHPTTYTLSFVTVEPEQRPAADMQERDVLPLQGVMARLCGEDNSLTALRGLFALIHGFAMLEIHDQLRRGGDLDDVFHQVLEVYLRGWQ